MRSRQLKTSINSALWVVLCFLLVSCEEEAPDYTTELIGSYIVDYSIIDGSSTDYSAMPLEETRFVVISSSSFTEYANFENLCDTNSVTQAKVITDVTDTLIYFDDGTHRFYALSDDGLILTYEDDQYTLSYYSGTIPPTVWGDPSLLTNDVYEPDNSFVEATSISAAGSSQEHYQAVCDDEDYFKFDALGGTIYIIDVSAKGSPELDLTLTLFTAEGDTVAFNDDRDSNDLDPELEWLCDEDGEYYFVVKKYWDYLNPGDSTDDAPGTYTATVDVTKELSRSSNPQHPKISKAKSLFPR